jgi:hypothetical protein
MGLKFSHNFCQVLHNKRLVLLVELRPMSRFGPQTPTHVFPTQVLKDQGLLRLRYLCAAKIKVAEAPHIFLTITTAVTVWQSCMSDLISSSLDY